MGLFFFDIFNRFPLFLYKDNSILSEFRSKREKLACKLAHFKQSEFLYRLSIQFFETTANLKNKVDMLRNSFHCASVEFNAHAPTKSKRLNMKIRIVLFQSHSV